MYKLCFIFLFLSFSCFSNSNAKNFVLTKSGERIDVSPSFFKIDDNERCIFYKTLNGSKEVKMNFKDLDYLIIRNSKFKAFKFKDSNEIDGCFVLCESSNSSLIFKTASLDDSNTVHYEFFVVDQDLAILENHKFDNLKSTKSAWIRADIFGKIKFFFGNCTSLIERLSAYDINSFEDYNLRILAFFDLPLFISCL